VATLYWEEEEKHLPNQRKEGGGDGLSSIGERGKGEHALGS